MDGVILKCIDLLNGIIASGFYGYMLLCLSRKLRITNRNAAMTIIVLIYQFGTLLNTFLIPHVPKDAKTTLSLAVLVAVIFSIIVTVNGDRIKDRIRIFAIFLIPNVLLKILLGILLQVRYDDLEPILGNEYIVSLLKIYAVTLEVVFCVLVIIFVNRKKLHNPALFALFILTFPIMGVLDLEFLVNVVPEKVNIINSIAGSILLYGTSIVSFLATNFVRRSREMFEQELRQVKLDSMRSMNREYYNEIKADLEYVSKIRHDVANYAEQMAYLMNHRNDESDKLMSEMLDNLKIRISEINSHKYCDDPLINMVITLKSEKCKELGITFSAKVMLPESVVADPLDRSSLLSNLIDNAIHAAVDAKAAGLRGIVTLNIGVAGDFIAIRISNDTSYEGEISDIRALIHTSESGESRNGHGYGLVIVKEILDKYNGNISVNVSDHKCVIMANIMNCVLEEEHV
ncbi:Signal transduction histidine kinase [Ruminococcaceae bacterium YRB3002]|nr:Signal transduction histidine kinase [Ruminococcaceae bacterium YRB3002]